MGPDAFEKLEKGYHVHPGSPKLSPEILQELCRCQVAIPVFHGPQGEDGMIQGLLETFGILYTTAYFSPGCKMYLLICVVCHRKMRSDFCSSSVVSLRKGSHGGSDVGRSADGFGTRPQPCDNTQSLLISVFPFLVFCLASDHA